MCTVNCVCEKVRIELKCLGLKQGKYANRRALAAIMKDLKETRQMERDAMEKLIAAKIAECENDNEKMIETTEWSIVGQSEDDKENTVEALEELLAKKEAERISNARYMETYNATKHWKLKQSRFS